LNEAASVFASVWVSASRVATASPVWEEVAGVVRVARVRHVGDAGDDPALAGPGDAVGAAEGFGVDDHVAA
jgi:hypothetical protein